jgi:hypothetical protein
MLVPHGTQPKQNEAINMDYVIETLKIIQDDSEERQDYLQRVAVEIQALAEDAWNAVPDDLKDWYNNTAELLANVPEGEEVGELPELPIPKPKGKKGRPKKVVEGEEGEAPVKKEKKEKKEKEERGPTAANIVRELLCENMDLTLDEILEMLPERGVQMQRSSMQVVALNTVRAFEMIISLKEVKDKDGNVVITAV